MAIFYEIEKVRKYLGLNDTVTLKDIKIAYKRLTYRFSPDGYKT